MSMLLGGIPGREHHAIQFDILNQAPHKSMPPCHIFIFERANFDQFREILCKTSWDRCHSDSIEDAWTSFKGVLLAAANEYIPHGNRPS